MKPAAGPVSLTGWVRLDDRLLAWGDDAHASARRGLDPERPDGWRPENLYLVTQVGDGFRRAYPDAHVVVDKGRYLVVAASAMPSSDPHACYAVRPVPVGATVLRTVTPEPITADSTVRSLVDAVSASRLAADIAELADLGTRHSMSAGFTEALGWARDRLEELGWDCRTTPVAVGSGTSANLLADRGVVHGEHPPVLIGAHLDSINQLDGPDAPAPGADDNGSGAAGLLEMARLLADLDGAPPLRLALFGGEEQGLFGSTSYVASMSEDQRARVRLMINMDMIGVLNTPTPTVLLEGGEVSQVVVGHLARLAATYTGLSVQTSFSPYNSDHVPFIDAGMPGVLTIEGNDRENANVHTPRDTPSTVDASLAAQIVGLNLAAVATPLS